MKRTSITSTLVVIASFWCQAQSISALETDSCQVKLLYYFHCNDSITEIKDYSLTRIHDEQDLIRDPRIYYAIDGICTVPSMHKYEFNGTIENLEHNVVEAHSRFEIDTIHVYGIYRENLLSLSSRSSYLCCGNKCNGHFIDYWNNGSIRREGDFKSGQPITLVSYDRSGALLSEYASSKNRESWKQYSDGKLELKYWKFFFLSGMKIWDNENGKYLRY